MSSERFRPSGCGRVSRPHRGQHSRGHQLLPSAERHDAVAATGAVSDAQELVSLELRAGGTADIHVPVHRLTAAAAGGRDGRPQPPAVFARRRHGIHAGRTGAAGVCRQLRTAAVRGRPHRHRFLGVPPRVLARCAHGFRRQAWPGSVGVPGRAAISALPRAPSLPPSSCCRMDNQAWCGSRSRHCLGCSCSSMSATGTRRTGSRA